MDKNNPNKIKQRIQEDELIKRIIKNYGKPYKGPDGYLHCVGCRMRYEPGHKCTREYK